MDDMPDVDEELEVWFAVFILAIIAGGLFLVGIVLGIN